MKLNKDLAFALIKLILCIALLIFLSKYNWMFTCFVGLIMLDYFFMGNYILKYLGWS
jgi:hypothetical protein